MNSRFATTQSRVLALVTAAGRYRCQTLGEQRAARKLNIKGLIGRDGKDGWVWYPAGDARAMTGRASA